MLENAVREPFDGLLTALRLFTKSNRQIDRTFSTSNNIDQLSVITWDSPAWPLLTGAPTPVPQTELPAPTQPSLWLAIILILPMLLAINFARFLLKRGITQAWLRYVLAQLPFIGTTLILLVIYLTTNPDFLPAITILTIIVLLFVLLVEEVIMLFYVIKQRQTEIIQADTSQSVRQ